MNTTNAADFQVLRELARGNRDACRKPVMVERRNLWRMHNSLRATRPPIYVHAFAWLAMPEWQHLCADPFFRR